MSCIKYSENKSQYLYFFSLNKRSFKKSKLRALYKSQRNCINPKNQKTFSYDQREKLTIEESERYYLASFKDR